MKLRFCVIIFLSILVLGLEGCTDADVLKSRAWIVVSIHKDDLDITNEYLTHNIKLLDENKILLPTHKSTRRTLPLQYGTWSIKRRGFSKKSIIIKDVERSVFEGSFDIKIVNYREPPILILTSKTTTVKLQAIEQFTLRKTRIEY